MKLEDLRQQVRAELAAVDADGAADPAEIDRLVREVIVFLSTSAEDQVNAAARIAEASPSPRDRELWLRRAERLRQGVVALQVALRAPRKIDLFRARDLDGGATCWLRSEGQKWVSLISSTLMSAIAVSMPRRTRWFS